MRVKLLKKMRAEAERNIQLHIVKDIEFNREGLRIFAYNPLFGLRLYSRYYSSNEFTLAQEHTNILRREYVLNQINAGRL